MVDMILNLFGLIFSVLILAKAADILVKNLSHIANHKRWSEFTVSIMLAFATSFPEFTVGITAALDRQSNLSLGNVIGSNIANVTIIVGLIAVASGAIRVTVREKKEDSLYAAAISIAPLVLIIDGYLSRIDGVLLLTIFAIYMRHVYKNRNTGVREYKKPPRPLGDYIVITAFGLLLLLLSSKVLVNTAENTATSLGMPIVFVGLFIVAIGTSLPELFFGIKAAIRKKGEMIMGDLLGAIIFNAGLTLGLTALISPITLTAPLVVYSSGAFLVISILLFTRFLRTEYKITRLEGIILVMFFVLFTALEFSLKIV